MRTSAWALGFLLAALVALGCEISPVVSAPVDAPSGRYYDCERAAENYCDEVEAKAGDARDRCVAERTYDCVSASRR